MFQAVFDCTKSDSHWPGIAKTVLSHEREHYFAKPYFLSYVTQLDANLSILGTPRRHISKNWATKWLLLICSCSRHSKSYASSANSASKLTSVTKRGLQVPRFEQKMCLKVQALGHQLAPLELLLLQSLNKLRSKRHQCVKIELSNQVLTTGAATQMQKNVSMASLSNL